MKICRKCREPKPLDDFTKDRKRKDGHNIYCRTCTRAAGRQYAGANPDKARERSQRWVADNPDRQRERTQRWKAENKERHDAYFAKYRSANREQLRETVREHYRKNIERERARSRETYAKNKPAAIARWALREARKLQATPKWADAGAIQRFYDAAKMLTDVLGEQYNVDHVVPLRHPLVCGLHWEGNLQLLTEAENKSKGNRYWPDMPE